MRSNGLPLISCSCGPPYRFAPDDERHVFGGIVPNTRMRAFLPARRHHGLRDGGAGRAVEVAHVPQEMLEPLQFTHIDLALFGFKGLVLALPVRLGFVSDYRISVPSSYCRDANFASLTSVWSLVRQVHVANVLPVR